MPKLATPSTILGQYEKFLIYGEYGTGKTQLALTAPGPIWMLCVGRENELKTLYSKKFIDKHGLRTDVFFDVVEDERGEQGEILDNPQGYDNACRAVDKFLLWNEEQEVKTSTIIVDNATVLERMQMDKAIAFEHFAGGSKDLSKDVLLKEREWSIRKPHDSTYGGAQSLMSKFVSWMFTLPFNIVFIAHEYKVWEKVPGSRAQKLAGVLPLFVGQQRTDIPNLFDNVWRTTVSGGGSNAQYEVQTVASGGIAAKSRVGGLLNPSMERNVNLTEVIQSFKDHATQLESL